MRRFLITSPAFTGEADILYDETGRLIKIDLMATNMNASMIQGFKARVPALVDSLVEAFEEAKAQVTILEASFEVSFDMFWSKYDKKINKARCVPLWSKLSKVDQVSAFYGVDAYDKFLNKSSWKRPKADPEKYLKDRYWENEWK